MDRKRKLDEGEEEDDGAVEQARKAPRPNPKVEDQGEGRGGSGGGGDGSGSDDDSEAAAGGGRAVPPVGKCPYLDTIDRNMLDFDFEKLCSVTLSNLNVYACLVCGKYFQGRGQKTPAYTHCLQANHHVFINLHTCRVYSLPEGYEVFDSSLDDIKHVLNPKYTSKAIAEIDTNKSFYPTLDGTEYLPGCVGLNNIKKNDGVNVVIQALIRVPRLRDYFLDTSHYAHVGSELVQCFGDLVRKMWSPSVFRGHVSPHEFLQAVTRASKKKFSIGAQIDPLEFLTWFLNRMHLDLGGTSKLNSSVIFQTFQGKVRVSTRKAGKVGTQDVQKGTTETHPFLHLSLDLPAVPLFKEEAEKNSIPQVSVYSVLSKFDGETEKHIPQRMERKKYIIEQLPDCLILHISRFVKNLWYKEKNNTIVNFPVTNLDLSEFVIPELKSSSTKYDLLCNIVHEGKPGEGTYKLHVLHKGRKEWYEIQDLMVQNVLSQLIPLSESYLLFLERKK